MLALLGFWLRFMQVASEAKTPDRPEARFAPSADYIEHHGYIAARAGHHTQWTLACLTADSLNGHVSRAGMGFYSDESQGAEWRWRDSDYDGTGYDRGHKFAAESAGDSKRALHDSFVLTNTFPQTPELNRGPWHALENHVRSLAVNGATVYDLVLDLYLPSPCGIVSYKRLNGRIDVPTHCGRAVLIEYPGGKYAMKAWILWNSSTPDPFDKCEVTVDELESAAGLDLWSALDDAIEGPLEAGK